MYLEQDLQKYIDARPKGIEPPQIKSFMFQLLAAVAFCHVNKSHSLFWSVLKYAVYLVEHILLNHIYWYMQSFRV